jgi:hypothetical protein
MNHPWCTAIITEDDQEVIERSHTRLCLNLLMWSAVIENLPQWLDAKLLHAAR